LRRLLDPAALALGGMHPHGKRAGGKPRG